MKNAGYTIVDVRSPMEFQGGHVAGSVNIPLQEVPSRVREFADMPKPLMLVCASGNRSGQAVAYLRQQGVDCENGGGWLEANYRLQHA